MNFHKNYYKLCLPSLVASAAVLLLGIAFSLIFGYNTTVATPYGIGGIIFYLGIYLLALGVFNIVYLRVRFNWSTGFVVVLKNFVDAFLILAIIAIVRIPLTLETFIAIVIATLYSNVLSLALLCKANRDIKTETDFVILNNNLIEGNIKLILPISFAVMIVVCVFFGTGLQNMLSFVLGSVVGIVVSTITALFMLTPVWLGFVKRELKIKQKSKKEAEKVEEKAEEPNTIVTNNETQI